MTLPSVAMIGAGAMGGAVVAGLLRAGWRTDQLRVVVRSDPSAARVRELYGVEPVGLAVAATSHVVVLATKPAQILPLLDELSPLLGGVGRDDSSGEDGSGQVVASLAVGLSTAAMQKRLPAGVPVVRVMPNTPALVGAGVSVLSGGQHAHEEHLAAVEQVMGAVGSTMRVPEDLQNAVGALSGSGPAYVFYVVDAMAEAGVLLGLSRDMARELAVRTVLGAATMLAETGAHPVLLREQVSSPGGTTVAALRVLDERGVRAAFLGAMAAARDRSAQIGGTMDAG